MNAEHRVVRVQPRDDRPITSREGLTTRNGKVIADDSWLLDDIEDVVPPGMCHKCKSHPATVQDVLCIYCFEKYGDSEYTTER